MNESQILSTYAATLFALLNPLGMLPVFIGYASGLTIGYLRDQVDTSYLIWCEPFSPAQATASVAASLRSGGCVLATIGPSFLRMTLTQLCHFGGCAACP